MAPVQYPQLQDVAWLQARYVEQAKSAQGIADEIGGGCSKHAVYHALKKHGITSRPHSSKFPQLNDKDWLREHYIDKGMSLPDIAALVGSSVGNVHSHLKTASIPTRDKREGLKRDADGKVIRRNSATRGASISQSFQEKAERGERIAGEKHHHWTGGRIRKGPYMAVYRPGHPRTTQQNPYVLEHILVAEEKLGRFLEKDEVVHHRNHVKTDNRPENLVVKLRGQHAREHWAEGRRAAQATIALEQAEARISYLEGLLSKHNIAYV